MRYFWRTKRKSTKTITERCFSCQNKSVCQKLARSCKKWKSVKIRYMPFLHERLQLILTKGTFSFHSAFTELYISANATELPLYVRVHEWLFKRGLWQLPLVQVEQFLETELFYTVDDNSQQNLWWCKFSFHCESSRGTHRRNWITIESQHRFTAEYLKTQILTPL